VGSERMIDTHGSKCTLVLLHISIAFLLSTNFGSPNSSFTVLLVLIPCIHTEYAITG
jgi:hypothetical protein